MPNLRHHFFTEYIEYWYNKYIHGRISYPVGHYQYPKGFSVQEQWDTIGTLKAEHNKFSNLLKQLRGEFLKDYHLFIIGTGQFDLWEFILTKYNLSQYIIYKSERVLNFNYFAYSPRIEAYILKFPDDYKMEIRPMNDAGELIREPTTV